MSVESQQWFPVATLLAGFAANGILEWFRHRSSSSREVAARVAERCRAIEERRARFQRESLLALQEAMVDLTRAVANGHFHDLRAFRQGNGWRKTYLPEDVDQAIREANQQTALLNERVADENVRKAVEYAKGLASGIFFTSDSATAEGMMTKLGNASIEVQKQIGIVLRKLDEE